MNHPVPHKNRRVLVIDDNHSIHGDFRKILSPATADTAALEDTELAVFGERPESVCQTQFRVDSAYQGQEGLELVKAALAAGEPYGMAFVDVRMPPGWDGVETTRRIWELDPSLQVVLCTAYSDYSWSETFEKLGQSDGLLILKKPFDTVEALQLAHALTEKWWLHQESRRKLEMLEHLVAERTRELRHANAELHTEVLERQTAEQEVRQSRAALHELNVSLEQRVAERTDDLLTATLEAERANRAKSEFLSRTSHELRTPMNAILGFGQLLESEENLGVQPRESVDQILHAGRHLLTLIDELLDLSNAESDRLTLALRPVAVHPLIEEALSLARPLCAPLQVTLRSAPAHENWQVLADPQRLKQVLLNLLANAIKYNRPGGQVRLECGSLEAVDPPACRISVIDTGPGISAANLPRLFTPFDRLGAERTRTGVVGTGLGLALSKRMIELMAGRIGVESVVGQGSTFWIELPTAAVPLEEESSLRAGGLLLR